MSMSIDYSPSDGALSGRKCRVLAGWGKIRLVCGARSKSSHKKNLVAEEGLDQVEAKIRPCTVWLNKCKYTPPSGLVWNSNQEVKLENETVESHTCPKCGKFLKNISIYRVHVLSHYRQVFHKVLPNTKPYTCP